MTEFVIEIVIEICMEQTKQFQCTLPLCRSLDDFRD